jgi:hypothetical protein
MSVPSGVFDERPSCHAANARHHAIADSTDAGERR